MKKTRLKFQGVGTKSRCPDVGGPWRPSFMAAKADAESLVEKHNKYGHNYKAAVMVEEVAEDDRVFYGVFISLTAIGAINNKER